MNLKKIIKEEIDDLQWIHDVSSKPLPMDQRSKVSITELIDSQLKHQPDEEFLTYLEYDDYVEYEEGGGYVWVNTPDIYYYEITDFLRSIDNNEWVYVDDYVIEQDLEYQQEEMFMIFNRKKDNRFFGLFYIHSYHEGITDGDGDLFEIYPKKITITTWV